MDELRSSTPSVNKRMDFSLPYAAVTSRQEIAATLERTTWIFGLITMGIPSSSEF